MEFLAIIAIIVVIVLAVSSQHNKQVKNGICITVLGGQKLYLTPNTYLVYDTPSLTSPEEKQAYASFKSTVPTQKQQKFISAPRKIAGYRFEGWYLDMELTIPLPHVVLVEEPFTIYPKYVKM